MNLFEVFLQGNTQPESLLSAEVLESSGAQIMTPEQAAFVGLEGIPADPEGRPRALIACGHADVRLIQTMLERNEGVSGFKLHQLA